MTNFGLQVESTILRKLLRNKEGHASPEVQRLNLRDVVAEMPIENQTLVEQFTFHLFRSVWRCPITNFDALSESI